MGESRFLTSVDSLSRYAGNAVAEMVLAAMAALVTVEVILRKVFSTSTLVSDEYSGYFMVALVYLGAVYILKTDKHIRIDVLYPKFPSRLKLWLQRVTSVLNLFALAVFGWQSFHMVIRAHELNTLAATVVSTPLWIPMSVLPLGFILLVLQQLVEIVRLFLPHREAK